MWLSSKIFSILEVSKESVDSLRQELSAIRAERDTLKHQLTVTQTQFDWLRLRVNQLEFERAQLLEKATGVKTTIPEIIRQPSQVDNMINAFSFEDVGDDVAKKLGLPLFNS